MLELRTMQQEVLECIARDHSLEQTMTRLCEYAERFSKGVVCSILAVDGEGRLNSVAAPNLPEDYSRALNGIKIGPSVGSCGTAAFLGEAVEVSDIDTDPRWGDFKHLALPLGLRACWSSPIRASDGRVVGAFAFYFRACRGPDPVDRAIVEACVNLCAIAFEQAERKARIERLAYHDSVTGVVNRGFFERFAQNALVSALGNSAGVTLHWIDLDRFKSLNDTLGHHAGDTVLREVARRIQAVLKPNELIARIGGDEFVVLQSTDVVDDVTSLGQRIVAAAAAPLLIDGVTVLVGASVGAARAPCDGRDLRILMKRADLALYQAKAAGRGRFSLFDAKIEAKVASHWQTEQALRRALGSKEFELHFQPMMELDFANISGFEALIRWRRPGHGLIPPNDFLPIAEKSGLIVAIGEWVLREACCLASRLPGSARIAVNLSALQLLKPGFALDVAAALASSGLPPSRLELEVTESTFLLEEEGTLACLADIRSLGVSIALDDFGTGCSALSHLRTFPVDRIKIDRSFVKDIGKGRTTSSIIRGVIAIARDLGVRTTAEGVETPSQLGTLRDFGCDEIQGYLIGAPQPLEFYHRQSDDLSVALP